MGTERESSDELERVRARWSELGEDDPLWAVLTEPGKAGGRWDEQEFLRTGLEEIDDVLALLSGLGLRPTDGTALDFGCGAGRLTQALSRRVGRAIGVDVSPGMVRTATSLNQQGDRCRFVLNDAPDLGQIDADTVDVVYSRRVLQHMAPGLALGYVAEFFRVARPGGVVVFQMPTRPARSLKGLGVRVLPESVATRLRRGMEMHGTPPEQVRRVVGAAGGTVVAEVADDAAGPGWDSVLYVCRPGPVPGTA